MCCIALSLHSAHIFRGRAERRDSGLRYTPATDSPSERCRFATLCVGPRRYGRLLVCVAAVEISGESAEPYGLRRLCAYYLPRPPLRQRAFLRRPDRTLETLWDCAPSLSSCKRRSDHNLSARRLSRPAPVAPIGLPARLFRASGVTAEAVTPAVRKSTSDWMKHTLERLWFCETSGPLGVWLEIFLHSSGTAAAPLAGTGFIVMK